jgi:hypothetical protein
MPTSFTALSTQKGRFELNYLLLLVLLTVHQSMAVWRRTIEQVLVAVIGVSTVHRYDPGWVGQQNFPANPCNIYSQHSHHVEQSLGCHHFNHCWQLLLKTDLIFKQLWKLNLPFIYRTRQHKMFMFKQYIITAQQFILQFAQAFHWYLN